MACFNKHPARRFPGRWNIEQKTIRTKEQVEQNHWQTKRLKHPKRDAHHQTRLCHSDPSVLTFNSCNHLPTEAAHESHHLVFCAAFSWTDCLKVKLHSLAAVRIKDWRSPESWNSFCFGETLTLPEFKRNLKQKISWNSNIRWVRSKIKILV